MTIDRRTFLGGTSLLLAAGTSARERTGRRIATEEAFAIPEQMEAMRELAGSGADHPDLDFWRALTGQNPFAETIGGRLLDLDGERLRLMDQEGVDMQLLLLTSTGVQMLEAGRASELAQLANDRLAEAIRRHPGRYAGLGVVPTQDVPRAIRELERAIKGLGLNGIVINSHTNGEYLDERKYWPLLEAAAALGVPIYIHPRAPSPAMAAPYRPYRLEGAIWGYQAETGLHALRLIVSGAFDAFPDLRIVLGHMGEGLPYWLWRVDHMHAHTAAGARPKLKLRPSDYFRRNFLISTSGMNWEPVLKFCLSVLGADNLMWAIDYPYQDTRDSVRFLDNADITREEREKIFHRNAERIFGIAG